MFITELFVESDDTQRICLTDLSRIPHKYIGVIQRLARFHRVGLEYDKKSQTWFANDTEGINPFMKDVKHITSAAGMGASMHEDSNDNRKLIAIFRKGPTTNNPHAMASKIYLWKTGPGQDTFEMEIGQDRKRIPVTLSFAQIRQTLAKKGFNESIQPAGKLLVEAQVSANNRKEELKKELARYARVEAGGNALSPGERKNQTAYKKELAQLSKKNPLPEASMTKSVPSKKEGVFNKGVEKSLGQQVAVIVLDHPDSVAYGKFVRIGETGLCHIKLNGGKLPGWASGDKIAVRPSEVYSTWDPRLQGKTAVHREYSDTGEKTVRENNKPKVTDVKTGKQYDPEEEIEKMYSDPEYIAQMQRMGREEGRGWPKRNQDKEK